MAKNLRTSGIVKLVLTMDEETGTLLKAEREDPNSGERVEIELDLSILNQTLSTSINVQPAYTELTPGTGNPAIIVVGGTLILNQVPPEKKTDVNKPDPASSKYDIMKNLLLQAKVIGRREDGKNLPDNPPKV